MKYGQNNGFYRSLAMTGVIFSLLCSEFTSANVLEEVIITAQKREQSLQDVGISVSAFSGDQLKQLGYTNTTDITAQTPALNFSSWSPSLTFLNIRGVAQSDFADHHEPPNALYIDEAYVSSMGAVEAQMFDLERVEVLRGPQGTLFGRNATGGLLHLLSTKPSEEFEAYAEVTFAEYEQVKLEGAVGGALTDSILGRLSIATNRHDGWLDNRTGEDLGDAESYAIRGQLLFDLSEGSDLLLKLHHSEYNANGAAYSFAANGVGPNGLGVTLDRTELGTFVDFFGNTFQTCPGCNAHWYTEPDGDRRTGSVDEVGDFDRSITGMTGKFTMSIGDVELTSITDYLVIHKDYLEDTDASPVVIVRFFTDQNLKQFSQEVRLHAEKDRFNWTAGAYYLDIDNDTASGLAPINIAPFLGLNFPGAFVPLNTGFVANTSTESWALFGHAEYDLSSKVTLIAALRYTEDEKTADYTLSDDTPPPPFGPGPVFQQFNSHTSPFATQEFENVAAKVEIDWKPTDDLLLYASYNRGHKAGSFNYPFIGPVNFSALSHDEEVLTSIEAGFKGTFQDGRIRLNVSAFYYDYKDHQASFFVNLSNIIGNVDAEAYGLEAELVVSATDRLEFMLGASFEETETKDVGMPDGSVQDRELSFVPDFTLNGLARYTWPMAKGNLTAQVDFNYSDDYCFTVVCHFSERADSYVVGNARLTYTASDEKWSVSAFVRNLGDTDYRIYATDASFVGFHTDVLNPPRWFGATFSYYWR